MFVRKSTRRAALFLAGLIGGLALVEATLQAASFLTWATESVRRESAAGGAAGTDARVVLCLGDSFTFGLGTSRRSESYPAQLESRLTRDMPAVRWRVVNGGMVARSSAGVLEATPALLEKHRPDYVCVLAGFLNRLDARELAAERALVTDPNAWTWRLRTLRLAQLILAERFGRAATEAEPAAPPAPASRPVAASRTPRPAGDSLADTLQAILDKPSPRATAGASPHLTAVFALAKEVRSRGDLPLSRLLVQAALRVEAQQLAIEEAEWALQRFGDDRALSLLLVRALQRDRRLDEAAALAERLTVTDPSDSEGWRALSLVRYAQDDPRGGLGAMLRAFAVGDDADALASQLQRRNVASVWPRDSLEAFFDEQYLSPAQAEAVRRLIDQGAESEDPRLAADLAAMLDRIAGSGARALVLTYPGPEGKVPAAVNRSLRKAAAEDGLPLVDLAVRFDSLAAHHGDASLYQRDGHPTDRGNGLVAEAVAEAIIAQERSSSGPGHRGKSPRG